jgi:hypothetical protein
MPISISSMTRVSIHLLQSQVWPKSLVRHGFKEDIFKLMGYTIPIRKPWFTLATSYAQINASFLFLCTHLLDSKEVGFIQKPQCYKCALNRKLDITYNKATLDMKLINFPKSNSHDNINHYCCCNPCFLQAM